MPKRLRWYRSEFLCKPDGDTRRGPSPPAASFVDEILRNNTYYLDSDPEHNLYKDCINEVINWTNEYAAEFAQMDPSVRDAAIAW